MSKETIYHMKGVSQFTGKPLEETLIVKDNGSAIQITDSEGKILVSLAPFLDGGSIWLADSNSIIMDKDEDWGTRDQVISGVSTSQILEWKEDSEKLEKIRAAQKLIEGVSE